MSFSELSQNGIFIGSIGLLLLFAAAMAVVVALVNGVGAAVGADVISVQVCAWCGWVQPSVHS